MSARSKPFPYNRLHFYATRAVTIISCVIVLGIVGFLTSSLLSDKFKIPWTLIIVFLTALINLIIILFTSLLNCCGKTSALFNILLDIPLLILWLVSISLLTWNIWGALGHSCSITNWGNSQGMMVCNVFKLLWSFVFFGIVAHIAQLFLDVRARRRQSRLGKYDKMSESQQDIKIDDLKPLARDTSVHDQAMASDTSLQRQEPSYPPAHSFRDDQQSYSQQQYHDESPGWRPGQKQERPQPRGYTSSSNSVYNGSRNRGAGGGGGSGGNDDNYYSHDNGSSIYMQDFSYQRPQPATRHDSDQWPSGGYGYQQDHGYQQNHYYQSRY